VYNYNIGTFKYKKGEKNTDDHFRYGEAVTVTAKTAGQRWQIVRDWHFWLVVVVFAVCTLLQYPQIITGNTSSLLSFLGLSRHAVERILFLFPVGYAAFIFGTTVGIVSLAAAAVIMLPRVIFFSQYLPDALLETIGVILIGALIISWFDSYRKEREKRQGMLTKLQQADEQLQSVFQITRRNEERLWALNEIAAILGQSLELKDILRSAAGSIKQVMGLDVVLILLTNEKRQEFEVIAHVGFSKELASRLDGLKVSEGLFHRVIQTEEMQVIEDINQETGAMANIQKGDGVFSEIIVPIKVKGNMAGALVGAMRSHRQFMPEEIDLLITFGSQIGMAMENVRCFQRECVAAEQALVSEKRHREIFENAHDAIWVHDLDGYITSANKAAEALTGFSMKEAQKAQKMNVKDFLTDESLALAGQVRQKLFAGEKVDQPYEQRIVRRDGTEAIVKLSTTIVMEDGKSKGFQNIARDVTREKEMQDKLRIAYQELTESHRRLKESQEQLIQAEKLTSLGQLAASIAHEVNNPLSGILTYTQLLEKKIKTDNYDKDTALNYLAKMEAELIRSTKLIRNLLDFARQSPPAFRQVNLNEIVNRAFDLTSHSAQLQHIQVGKELDPSLPSLMADFDQLQQVCTNLILNAIQAMPNGGNMHIRTSVDKNQVKLEVQDTGCGISPANMQKLFTPFFTTKREVKGVGLGLAVSYGIIQRHNGKIDVQSKEGEGTTFTISLPLFAEKVAERS